MSTIMEELKAGGITDEGLLDFWDKYLSDYMQRLEAWNDFFNEHYNTDPCFTEFVDRLPSPEEMEKALHDSMVNDPQTYEMLKAFTIGAEVKTPGGETVRYEKPKGTLEWREEDERRMSKDITYCAEDKCHNHHCTRNAIHAPDNAPASYANLRGTEYCELYKKKEADNGSD